MAKYKLTIEELVSYEVIVETTEEDIDIFRDEINLNKIMAKEKIIIV